MKTSHPWYQAFFVAIAVLLSSSISYVMAQPTSPPPNSSIALPINTGSEAQAKIGDLGAGRFCLGADCIDSWEGAGGGDLQAVTDTGATTTNDLSLPRLIDIDNTAFSLDPSGTSYFNEIEIDGETRNSWQRNFLVYHTQSSQTPSQNSQITSGPIGEMSLLWNGYSYVGSAYHDGGVRVASNIALDGTGSCTETFKGIPATLCGDGTCDYAYWGGPGDDKSYWLNVTSSNLPDQLTQVNPTNIGRCGVYETEKSILVRHSWSSSVPSAPAGWTQVWEGYTFMGMTGTGNYDFFTDLSSSGSCLPQWRDIPAVECYVSGNDWRCDNKTGGDLGAWGTNRNADSGPVPSGTEFSRISRCAVFVK